MVLGTTESFTPIFLYISTICPKHPNSYSLFYFTDIIAYSVEKTSQKHINGKGFRPEGRKP
jgi:hypothetical protein